MTGMWGPTTGVRRLTGILIAAVLAAMLFAPRASAATTTINFDTPVISGSNSPQAGPVLGDQYQAQGVVFAASFPAIAGTAPFNACGGNVYRDTAYAHSGHQVGYSFCQAHGEDFDQDANISGEIADLTNSVSVYAGSPKVKVNGIQYGGGGQTTTLTGYNTNGAIVERDSATVGTTAGTLLSITDPQTAIAYFSVSGPGSTSVPLEIDDLSFEVPATPPPPQIAINPIDPTATSGAQGQTLSVSVSVDRYSGADDPVTLAISGLPAGVTLTGGQTIPAGSDSTTLTFAIAPGAHVASSAFTLSASTADASNPPSLHGTFSVTAGLILVLAQSSITSAPCASSTVVMSAQQYAPGSSTLTVSGSGDTTGLTTSVHRDTTDDDATLTLTSNGTGGSGTATYTITLADGSVPTATATLTVNRVGLAAQGLYVTQGTQFDNGQLIPSGTGTSGGNYSGVTLVAGKTTVVRLYVDPGTTTGVAGAVAQLSIYRNGHLLGTLDPDYGPLNSSGGAEATLPNANAGPGEVVTDKELESNANAYTFTLPDAYTYTLGAPNPGTGFYYPQGQTVTLVGTALPSASGVQTNGCHSSDTFTLNNLQFREVGQNYDPQIEPFPMTVNGKQPPPPEQVFQDASAVTPLPDFPGLGIEPYFATIDITDIANSTQGPCGQSGPTNAAACANNKNSAVLGRLENATSSYPGSFSHAVGVNLGVARGLTNGVPGQYSVVDGTANYRPLTSVAHEVFHEFGVLHASNSCGGGAGGFGEPWPPDQAGHLNGIGLNTTSEPYQFVANGVPETLNGSTFTIKNAYDFMSYCSTYIGADDPGNWVSPRNWQQLVSTFGVGPTADTARAAHAARATSHGASVAAPLAAVAAVDPQRLSVLGFVTSTGLDITSVGPQVGAPLPPGNANDSYTLTAVGAGGHILTTVPMAATTGGHIDGPTPLPLVQVTGEVPARGVDSLRVADNGSVVATRTRPAKAPRVRILAPRAGARVGKGTTVAVHWRTTDPEHLPLTTFVDYSRNGGRTWRTIFTGPNTGRLALPSFFFTASRMARVRVRVSDGFNETMAVSPRFVTLGAPPKVTILTRLARGMRIAGDAHLQLSGHAVDQAAQILSGRQLRWYDGSWLLGTGDAISAGPLPSGVDHLRLVARDPSGRTATATLTVTVSPVALPFLRLKLPARVSADARTLTFTASASLPTTLRVGRSVVQLTTRTRKFVLKITRGRTPMLLALSATANGVTTPFAAQIKR